jgi:PAS domain S-box-containing protein
MVVMEHTGVLSTYRVLARPEPPWKNQLVFMGIVAGLLYVTAYFAASNADQLRKSQAAQRRLNEGLGERARARAAETLAARAAAELSEGSMRMLFASGPLPMVVWDWETQDVLEVNEQALVRYGFQRAEALTSRLTDFMLPEEVPRMQALRTEATRAGRQGILRSGPWKTRSRDGSIIEVEMVAHPIVFGGRTARVGVLIDVTEQRRAEEEVRRLAAIVQASDDAIMSVGLDGIVLSWNPGAERMYCYPSSETVGMPLRLLTPPDRRDDTEEILSRIARGDVIERHEIVQLARDGRRLDVSLKASPIRDAAGTVTAASVIARDVTERKRLEESLRQSQKMETIGQLAGGVAHDFNNHLTVILGGLEILAERVESAQPDLSSTLAQVNLAAERSAELTRQLLTFGRRQALQPKVLDVNRLVLNMGNLLRRTFGETIDLEVVRGAGLWKTEADPGQLESAVLNLAINARDAMPRGGCLTIETSNAFLDEEYVALNPDLTLGQYVVVAVSDTGTGMSAEVRDRAFEPFFTTKALGEGTGLGLSMVYGFVKQSGGHVKIYSEPGRGTTVRLYLPRARRDQEAAAPTATAVPTGEETILVVEDEPDVRDIATHMLAAMGYRLLEAPNAADALTILDATETIDLLFSDVVLPGGMSGHELADEARRRRPGLKVLFTSGYTPDAGGHQGRLDDDIDLLSKPYKRADLARKIRQALERS